MSEDTPKPKKKKENLRQRAYLNTVTNGIDFGTQQIVGFVLNPIMVGILGPIYFGAWKVIQQLNTYMAMSDLRVSQPLKLYLSKERSVRTDAELQEKLSEAFFAMLLFIPLYVIVGAILVWFAPMAAGVDPDYYVIIRSAAMILVSAFVLKQLFSVAEAVLRGMNLAYKRIGARAGVVIVGGLLSALLLYQGYGIIGLAMVQLFNVIVTGLIIRSVVKREIPWFRLKKVPFNDLIAFIRVSGWFMVWKVVKLSEQSIDMILLGVMAGPEMVSIYAITKYVPNASLNAVNQFLPALSPTIGKFFGERDYSKLAVARSQLISMIWGVFALLGLNLILWNESFIALWTTKSYYSGSISNLLILILSLMTTLNQVDSSIINLTLNLKRKIFFTAIASIVSISIAYILIPLYSISGLLMAMLAGRVLLLISYPITLNRLIEGEIRLVPVMLNRSALVTGAMFVSIYFLNPGWQLQSWVALIICIALTSMISLPLIWYAVFNRDIREEFKTHYSKIHLFKKD